MYITCEQLKSLMLKEDLSQSNEHCIGLLVKELQLSLENYYKIKATSERGIGQSILDNHNLSSYSGLALGLGLDRLVMILKQIDDIRILYDDREKIQEQMRNLSKYKEISRQPSIQRDMSIAIPSDMNEEELTEIISTNLNPDILNIVESIKLVEETSYHSLPMIAIQRLGMNESQKNVLLRVILRDLIISIPRAKANEAYNEIYEIVHCGESGYLIKIKRKSLILS